MVSQTRQDVQIEPLCVEKPVFDHCGVLSCLGTIIGLCAVESVGPESAKETAYKREPSAADVVASEKKVEHLMMFPHYKHLKMTRQVGYEHGACYRSHLRR